MSSQFLQLLFFWILALISVGSAILMVVSKNPVRSALFLVITFICVAIYYVTLSAQFIAAVQIIVYAGAIMVLFLFVIMLLNLGIPQALREPGTLQMPVAVALGLTFILLLVGSESVVKVPREAVPVTQQFSENIGSVEAIGKSLFDPNLPWLFPFEVTSVLLLVAVVGAIVMAKRRIE